LRRQVGYNSLILWESQIFSLDARRLPDEGGLAKQARRVAGKIKRQDAA
jgi:hypothetical protein